MKIVSACLAGINCRYDGNSNVCPKVVQMVKNGEAMPVCPEQLGGLSTPRTPAEITNNRFITKDGDDLTEAFQRGAAEALKLAKLVGANKAILKARSPSCGCGNIYDGTFSKKLKDGNGAFAQLLIDNGIPVKTEEDL